MSEFGAAVASRRTALFKQAMSLCRDHGRAEDLVQQAMLKALAYEHRFDPGTNLGAWLAVILRNEFYSEFRKSGRMSFDGGVTAEYQMARDDVEASLVAKDAISFIVLLPEDMQRALGLAARGYTYEEMAEELGVAEGTIKSRVSRARQQLAEMAGFNISP